MTGNPTGLLGEEAGGLWHRIPAERKRLRRKVVWQSCSARREECHAVEKKNRVFHTSKFVDSHQLSLEKVHTRSQTVTRCGEEAACEMERDLNSSGQAELTYPP